MIKWSWNDEEKWLKFNFSIKHFPFQIDVHYITPQVWYISFVINRSIFVLENFFLFQNSTCFLDYQIQALNNLNRKYIFFYYPLIRQINFDLLTFTKSHQEFEIHYLTKEWMQFRIRNETWSEFFSDNFYPASTST